jgi:hypothetical protein
MTELKDLISENRKLNKISTGIMWSLWNLLPIIGNIYVLIRVLNRLFASTGKKILMFTALLIPYVNIIGFIFYIVIIIKRIGGRFCIGYILVPFTIVFVSASGVCVYILSKSHDVSAIAQMMEIPIAMSSWENAVLDDLAEKRKLPADASQFTFKTPENPYFVFTMSANGTASVSYSARIKKGMKVGPYDPTGGEAKSTIDSTGTIVHTSDFAEKYLPHFVGRRIPKSKDYLQ